MNRPPAPRPAVAFALGAMAASWVILACQLAPTIIFRRPALYPTVKETTP